MRTVTITAQAATRDADGIFATICDFARYAELCDSIREVDVHLVEPDLIDSTWSVNFRSGILKWSERDRIDTANRRIRFTQTAGDFELFEGSWAVDTDGETTSVTFDAAFDLGMPSLASIIDPIAERTLRENMQDILQGLIGTDITFDDQTSDSQPTTAEPIVVALVGAM